MRKITVEMLWQLQNMATACIYMHMWPIFLLRFSWQINITSLSLLCGKMLLIFIINDPTIYIFSVIKNKVYLRKHSSNILIKTWNTCKSLQIYFTVLLFIKHSFSLPEMQPSMEVSPTFQKFNLYQFTFMKDLH